MRDCTSHRRTWMSHPATARIARDGEVPYIHWVTQRTQAHCGRPMKTSKLAVAVLSLFMTAVASQEVRQSALPPGHPLIGTWRIDLQNGCFEEYELRADGTKLSRSGEERNESIFEISERPLPSGFFRWVDKITKGNGKPDCGGAVTELGHVARRELHSAPPERLAVPAVRSRRHEVLFRRVLSQTAKRCLTRWSTGPNPVGFASFRWPATGNVRPHNPAHAHHESTPPHCSVICRSPCRMRWRSGCRGTREFEQSEALLH